MLRVLFVLLVQDVLMVYVRDGKDLDSHAPDTALIIHHHRSLNYLNVTKYLLLNLGKVQQQVRHVKIAF